MSHLQLTREQPPDLPDGRDEAAEDDDPAPVTDELRRAQARRLEIMELERASDEGMPPRRAQSPADERGRQEQEDDDA
jgi:hypothetical protein